MQLWKWLNSTALYAPEGEGDGGGKEPDKGTAANPIEFGFADDLGNMADSDSFVVEDMGNPDAKPGDHVKAAEGDGTTTGGEGDEEEEGDDDTAKGGDGDDTVEGGNKKPKKDAKADDDEDPDSKLPKGVRRRIARANAQRDAALAEAEALRKAKPKADDDDPAGIVNKGEAPNAADFDNYEEYLDAKKLFDQGKSKKAEPAKADDKKAADTDKDKAKPDLEVVQAITDIGDEIGETHADLWAKVTHQSNPLKLTITRDMLIAISDSDYPGEVLQALADKPELSKEIAGLSPAKQMARIVKLDKAPAGGKDKGDDTQGGGAQPGKKLSSAPEPIKQGGGRQQGEVDPIKDFSDFERSRNEEESKRSSDWW